MNILYRLFADVIEYRDIGKKIIILKHNRPGVKIKKGSRIHIRKNQSVALLKNDNLLATLKPGTYYLLPEVFTSMQNLFSKGYKSVVDIDLYMLNLKEFYNNPWSNKSPITLMDKDFSFIQIRAFGTFSFKISDPEIFMSRVFLDMKKYFTCNILLYISGFVARTVEECFYESGLLVTDLLKRYKEIQTQVLVKLKEHGQAIGVEYIDICIDNLSIPAMIEQLIEDKMWREIESKYKPG